MNIQDIKEKINSFLERVKSKEVYTGLLIILVGFASFGLGRLSKLEEQRVPVRIRQSLPSAETASAVLSSGSLYPSKEELDSASNMKSANPPTPGGRIVASKNGGKYHYPWCAGAQRILDANKVWLNSIEDARKAGYTPASNCKGLK